MPNNLDRAKQFLPFDALKGFTEALLEIEKNRDTKKDLFIDITQKINQQLLKLKKGTFLTIKYYYKTEYIETSGTITKIDFTNKYIHILNSKILFDDILEISNINNESV